MDEARRALVRRLNDRLRRQQQGGRLIVTAGVHALGPEFLTLALATVAAFERFEAGNDPYREHDCGAVTVRGQRLLWTIEYYNAAMTGGSPDPAEPSLTTRVLTVMLADEC